MDNFKVIYKILKLLEKYMDYEEVNTDDFIPDKFGVNENRFYSILEMLYDDGYITGLSISKSLGGTGYDLRNIDITIKGLEYLSENTMMKKAEKLVKGISDIIH